MPTLFPNSVCYIDQENDSVYHIDELSADLHDLLQENEGM